MPDSVPCAAFFGHFWKKWGAEFSQTEISQKYKIHTLKIIIFFSGPLDHLKMRFLEKMGRRKIANRWIANCNFAKCKIHTLKIIIFLADHLTT